ncbi:MAG: hypothetical protein MZV64_43195 [Ignavibacteriales bacterium]|nr:hypothetical protein [Ignavibacteriales bacterium]
MEVLDAIASQGIALRAVDQADAARPRPRRGAGAIANLRALAERSHATGNYLWIDMEQTSCVDVTLELTRSA